MIIPREQFIEALNDSWEVLPQRLEQLPDSDRQEYLKQQGYPGGYNGLLGHILSWWEDGLHMVERMRREPDFDNPDYEVDVFNARAVTRYRGFSKEEIVKTYQEMRARMVALVNSLSENELRDERINNRLRYEIIVHLEEHPLP